MLVLTRKNWESIVIGGANGSQRELKVTVLEIGGKRVKLGFEADIAVVIRRSETQPQFPPLLNSEHTNP
jgi:carbon storage regulator CsrA